MINKHEILAALEKGLIIANGVEESQIGPNSIDVHLGSMIKSADDLDGEIASWDCKNSMPMRSHLKDGEYKLLEKCKLYLAATKEMIGSDYYVPVMFTKSSIARLGIMTHLSAGLGDIGFYGSWTMEIVAFQDILVQEGMPIAQIAFFDPGRALAPQFRYNGKYTDQAPGVPVQSRLWIENEKNTCKGE